MKKTQKRSLKSSLFILLSGCTWGTDIKKYDELKDKEFPDVNSAPYVEEKQQKQMGKKLTKAYEAERKALEAERDQNTHIHESDDKK